MQQNTITLIVDPANNGTTVEQPITSREAIVNRTTYVFEATHTLSDRDQVQLYRTFAKRSGASRGSSRSAIKFTKDISVPNSAGDGDLVLPLIGEISFSVPIGTTVAETLLLRQRMIAILDDDAVSGRIVDKLDI